MKTQLRTLAIEHVMDIHALNMSDERLEAHALRTLGRAVRESKISATDAEPLRRALCVNLRTTRRIGELCRTAALEIEAGRKLKHKSRETASFEAASQQPRQV